MTDQSLTAEGRLKASFTLFLIYVWVRVLRLPRPTRVQLDIADYLANGPRRRFIAAFRGVGKTFLSAAYIVWRLWNNPDAKIMVVSANERFAAKIAAFIHTIINAEDVVSLEPVPWSELKARAKQKNSTMEFDVGPAMPDKDYSVSAFGITGQITGGRADLILFDDIEVPNNSETEAMREKLVDRAAEAAAILKPDGEVVYLGTFQSMASIYRNLRSKGYGMRLWPARYPTKDKLHLYEDTLAPLLKEDIAQDPGLMTPGASSLGGAPTDPARFTELDLMEREVEWGSGGFQLQFMLDTSLVDADRFPLKTRDLIIMDTARDVAPMRVAWGSAPEQLVKDMDNIGFDGDRMFRPIYKSQEWVPYTGSVLEIDPSGTGTDETAYVITKFLNGHVYVRKWGGYVDGHSDATLRALAEIAKEEEVNLIRVEANFGDGMFSRLLEPHLRKIGYIVPIEDHKVHGKKEERIIATVRPALQAHRIVMDTSLVRQDLEEARSGSHEGQGVSKAERSGLYQLTHMSAAKGALRKDDRIDVLSNALAYWAEYMGADAEEAERRAEAKATAEFEKALFGSAILPIHTRPTHRARGRGRRR
ncbi:phage terminase large subunit [Sphingopyxis flava]|uniref:Terminase large subunit ribonuclease H-like domain-containing protein n=1 Tax=Sphingopyxis flava TaxID=1507287 RepID=A0A1T5BR17_9SPHN|nr:phage terminase large subunit [Sphingopyxis flava]SKB49832.1 hypothetical protein SAMN06295937_100780 [Sphingopyxis flava]